MRQLHKYILRKESRLIICDYRTCSWSIWDHNSTAVIIKTCLFVYDFPARFAFGTVVCCDDVVEIYCAINEGHLESTVYKDIEYRMACYRGEQCYKV